MFSYFWDYFKEEEVQADEKSKRQKHLVCQQIKTSKMKLKKLDLSHVPFALDTENVRKRRKRSR